MVQVVFVHGVATRGGPEYEDQKNNRDRLLKEAVFRENTAILNPLWGDLMPPLAFNGDSFKKDKVQALSLAGGMTAVTAPQDATATSVLPQIAAKTPASAVDILFTERITRANAQGMPLSDADVKAFVAVVDLLDPGAPGDPSALAGARSDVEFVRQLRQLSLLVAGFQLCRVG
jgi:hypothetical protein